MMRVVIFIIVTIWTLVSLAWGIKAAYTAFISKKDERMKMIVMKSMAQSFVVLLILQGIHLIIKWGLGEHYGTWWANFTAGIYIEPLALGLMFFGTCMFINMRLFSAKGEK